MVSVREVGKYSKTAKS